MARTTDSRPFEFTFTSFATGHHIYHETWSPVIGEVVGCRREPTNVHDRHAVAVYKDGEIVGHIPRTISKPCRYALLAGASIYGVVVGERQNNGNGLEVPMKYHVKGPRAHMSRAQAYISPFVQ